MVHFVRCLPCFYAIDEQRPGNACPMSGYLHVIPTLASAGEGYVGVEYDDANRSAPPACGRNGSVFCVRSLALGRHVDISPRCELSGKAGRTEGAQACPIPDELMSITLAGSATRQPDGSRPSLCGPQGFFLRSRLLHQDWPRLS